MSKILAGTPFFRVASRLKYFLPNLRVTTRNSSDSKPEDCTSEDPVTHTGQKWEANDYRLSRFVDRPKNVNPNFGINLIAEVSEIPCIERVVWCDGGSGPTGHPKVYINLDKPGCHTCGYCGQQYYLDSHK